MMSKEIHLKSRPTGLPTAANFTMVEREIGEPGAGEILIQNHYMSVDPYMRGRMAMAWPLGEVMIGGALAPAKTVGDIVADLEARIVRCDHLAECATDHDFT